MSDLNASDRIALTLGRQAMALEQFKDQLAQAASALDQHERDLAQANAKIAELTGHAAPEGSPPAQQ